MRKALLMGGILLALSSATAFAAGVDLNWNACTNNTGAPLAPAANRNSACTSTTGGQNMVASFYAPSGITALDAIEVYVDFQTASGTIPCWWNFTTGATRDLALTPTAIDAFNCGPELDQTCFGCPGNYFGGKSGVGSALGMAILPGNRGRLSGAVFIPVGSGTSVLDGVENLGMVMRITNALTTTCAGCLDPACLVLNRIMLVQPSQPVIEINNAQVRQHVTWQNATGLNCPLATPAQNRTWGSIKALYR